MDICLMTFPFLLRSLSPSDFSVSPTHYPIVTFRFVDPKQIVLESKDSATLGILMIGFHHMLISDDD
jgi:hypothetical protein